jgi:hypothetical protein
LEEALTGIGFQGIYVEGMFMEMDISQILRKRLKNKIPICQLHNEIEEKFMSVVPFFTDWHFVVCGDRKNTHIIIGGFKYRFLSERFI